MHDTSRILVASELSGDSSSRVSVVSVILLTPLHRRYSVFLSWGERGGGAAVRDGGSEKPSQAKAVFTARQPGGGI